MKKSHKKNIACIWLATSILVLPLSSYAQSNEAEQTSSKGFAALLIPSVTNALISVITNVFTNGATCVLSNVFSFLGAADNPACKSKNTTQSVIPGNSGSFNTDVSSVPAVSASQAEGLVTQPMFAFVIKKLESNAPNAREIGEFASGKFAQGETPNFQIKTGESFSIAFSTTVPGRVHLINKDAEQTITQSPLYETIPGADNRMPRLHEGGILMAGKPGLETLDVVFTPCISPAYVNDSRVQPFVKKLDPCTSDSAIKQYKPIKAGNVTEIGKIMVFPANADPSKPVALAPQNYSKGELLRFQIAIDHVAN